MAENKNECRDFVRGVCNRGNSCKFFHPPHANTIKQEGGKLPICKDFQNKGCERQKCTFLHISQQEEEEYNRSGLLPDHGGRQYSALGGPGNGYEPFIPGNACRDFLNGVCQRGNRCKFRHISEQQHQAESGGPMHGKRRRNDMGGPGEFFNEEMEMLRRKVTDLQRQVVDLRQMNDTLYEQNNRYRAQLRQTGSLQNPSPYNSSTVSYPQPATGGADQYQGLAGYSKF